jgi:hypothetical protein
MHTATKMVKYSVTGEEAAGGISVPPAEVPMARAGRTSRSQHRRLHERGGRRA